MPETIPKIAAEQWYAFDKCECTDDDEQSGCILNENIIKQYLYIYSNEFEQLNNKKIPIQCYSNHAQQTYCNIWVKNHGENCT